MKIVCALLGVFLLAGSASAFADDAADCRSASDATAIAACSRLVAAGTLAAHPLTDQCAAISVGVVDALGYLDLEYTEDVRAEVDMNIVMTGAGKFIEVQGTAEGQPFSRNELDHLLMLAEGGITEIFALQRELTAEPPAPRRK